MLALGNDPGAAERAHRTGAHQLRRQQEQKHHRRDHQQAERTGRRSGRTVLTCPEIFDDSTKASIAHVDPAQLFANSPLPVLGCVPWSFDLIATRAIDMARHLKARVVNEGDIMTRRVKSVTFCARSIPHMLEHFRPGSAGDLRRPS
ncbi:DRTGG domain-containing protein [Serratia ureilytica]